METNLSLCVGYGTVKPIPQWQKRLRPGFRKCDQTLCRFDPGCNSSVRVTSHICNHRWCPQTFSESDISNVFITVFSNSIMLVKNQVSVSDLEKCKDQYQHTTRGPNDSEENSQE